MTSKHLNTKTIAVLLTTLMIIATIFLTGAAQHQSQIGRYRMATISRNSFTDIYVIDTATGIVKYVGKDQGKPFDAIEGQ